MSLSISMKWKGINTIWAKENNPRHKEVNYLTKSTHLVNDDIGMYPWAGGTGAHHSTSPSLQSQKRKGIWIYSHYFCLSMMSLWSFLSHLVGTFLKAFLGNFVPGYPLLMAFGSLVSLAVSRTHLSLSFVASRFPVAVGHGHLVPLTSVFVCDQRKKGFSSTGWVC